MFDISKVIECVYGVVGWCQSDDPCSETLDSDLLDSSSGVIINDQHGLVTQENISDTAPNFKLYQFKDWDVLETYNTGDRIRYQDVIYSSLIDGNIGNQPDTSTTEWQNVSLLSNWIRKKTKAFIGQFVSDIFIKKESDKVVKTIFDDQYIFTGTGKFNDLITKSNRFVGFEIKVKEDEDIKLIVNRIGLQLTEVQPSLDLYLFHSSVKEPLLVTNISTNKSNSFCWVELSDTIEMYYSSDSHDTGGLFYLGYYEEDLIGQAIRKRYNWRRPCGTCGGSRDFHFYRKWSKFASIIPVYFDNQYLDARLMPDIDGLREVYDNNFGLNLNISTHCDLSDFLCRHVSKHPNQLAKYIAMKFIYEMANSQRLNGDKAQIKMDAQMELDDSRGAHTIKQSVKQSMKSMDFNFSDLNSSCLPCSEPNGVRYKSV